MDQGPYFLNKSISLFYIRKLIGLTKGNLEKKEVKNKKKLFDELEKTIFLMKNLSENLNADFKIVYIPDILKFKNKEYNIKGVFFSHTSFFFKNALGLENYICKPKKQTKYLDN